MKGRPGSFRSLARSRPGRWLGDTPLVELEALLENMPFPAGGLLVDLGCGRGGPGLWVARRLKAVLLGMDLDTEHLRTARQLAVGYPATYLERDFRSTGLEDGCADGVVSFDALWHTDNLGQAIQEALRLLKPERRLAFTLVERERLELPAEIVYERPTPGWKERRNLPELNRRLVVVRRRVESPDPAP